MGAMQAGGAASAAARLPGRAAAAAVTVVWVLLAAGCGGGNGPTVARTSPPAPSPSPTTGVLPRPGFVPASASFPTPDDGFAWGVYPCGHRGAALCSGLAGTEDGGTRWRALPAPTGTPTDPYRRAVLRFADSQNGFAALGGLQATHDGGHSWQRVSLPEPDVAAVQVGGGFVAVLAGAAGGTGPLHLYVSPAAVDAFVKVGGVALPTAGASITMSLNPAGEGYLTADTAGSSPPLLYATADGLAWSGRKSPCAAGSFSTVAAGDGRSVTVICDSALTETGARKTTWTSSNGGVSFQRMGGPGDPGNTGYSVAAASAPPAADSTAAPSPGTSRSAGAPPLVVAASAREDRLYLSDDGGRTFTVAYASSSGRSAYALGLADLAFSDATHGSVILGDAGLYALNRREDRYTVQAPRLLVTQDAGRHWSQLVITE